MLKRLGSSATALLALACSGAAFAQPAAPPAPAASAAVDYGPAASWLCRPDAEAACQADLDAVTVDADGHRTPAPFKAAADPAIDCFYVYPTISADQTTFSDMVPGPEEREVVRGQVGRLAERCRLFAPVYRQLTMHGLGLQLREGGGAGAGKPAVAPGLDFSMPYRDVLAAWRWYMAHENHGRGVVLLGHSQGAIIIQRLLAEEIDGKPAQKQLVSAFLAGDPGLAVPKGAKVGGAFKSIPLCSAAPETGCVYVWGSYLASDTSEKRMFGHDPGNGMVASCVNPAAPGGGPGDLLAVLPRPSMAPASDPPWIEVKGQLSGECVADAQGDVLRISVKPGRYAELLGRGLEAYGLGPNWGLHRLDLSLPQGNILEVLSAETASWRARAPGR